MNKSSPALADSDKPSSAFAQVTGSAGTMQWINSTHYAMAQDGRTLAREEKYEWLWVLRDARGDYLDHDRYRYDLAERHGLTLI